MFSHHDKYNVHQVIKGLKNGGDFTIHAYRKLKGNAQRRKGRKESKAG